jgi:hypothetical protein
MLTAEIGTELATRAPQHFRQESKGHLTLGLGACDYRH